MPPVVWGGSSARQTFSPVVSTSMSCAQSSGVTMSCADSSRATPSHARYRARRQRTGERHRAVASRARASAAAPPPPLLAAAVHEPSGGPSSGRCTADADRGGSRSRCGSLRYAMTAFSYLGTLARPCRAPGATLWREKRLLQRQWDHIADIGHRPVGQSHRINNRALAARVAGTVTKLLGPDLDTDLALLNSNQLI